MKYHYVCIDCGAEFDEPQVLRGEMIDNDCERYAVCPKCHGEYRKAKYCASCGQVITDIYVKIFDATFCAQCVDIRDIRDERG